MLISLDPAVAALAGFVVLGQDFGLRELVAIAIVVVASAVRPSATVTTPCVRSSAARRRPEAARR